MAACRISPGMTSHPAFHHGTEAIHQEIPGTIIVLQQRAVKNFQAILVII
jgi:hypothetical protein